MRTEEEADQPDLTDLDNAVRGAFAIADEMDRTENVLLETVAMWLRREMHLAVERFGAALQMAMPEDTARFLAQDDMGFQIALAAARAWGEGKLADQDRTG